MFFQVILNMTKALKCYTRKRNNGTNYTTCDDTSKAKTKSKSKNKTNLIPGPLFNPGTVKSMLGEIDVIEPLDNSFSLPTNGKGTFESPVKVRKVKHEGAIPDPVKPGPRRSARLTAKAPIPKALNMVKPLSSGTMFNMDMKPGRKKNPKITAPKQRSSDSLFDQVSQIQPSIAAKHDKLFGKGGPLTVSPDMLPPKKVKKKKPPGMSRAVYNLM
tara:strand:- start:1518 stop:2162 length:645 start_codon:yes stop_codon:yes gene_type:complete